MVRVELLAGRVALVPVLFALAAFGGAAHAQDAGKGESVTAAGTGSADQPGEILVTALKRATNVQQTPIAITAISGKALGNANITDAYQLNRIAPGLIIRESANGGARITLRNIQAAGEPTVGLYYDDVPLIGPVGVNNDAGGANPDVRLFDVDRVEVLRGPQGTLYGSSSMAGTVRLIFAKPNLKKFEGAFDGMLTNVDGGGFGGNAQAMVNVPIVEDKLGVRAVGYYQHANGWIDNSLRGEKNINDSEKYGGRLMVRLKPTEDFTIDATAAIQRNTGFVNNWLWGTSAGKVDHSYDAAWPSLHHNQDDMDLFSLSGNYDLGFANLVATVSHQRRYLNYTSDSSQFFVLNQLNASRCRTYFSLAGSASCSSAQLGQYQTFALSQTPSAAYSEQTTKANTQEIRLSSSGKSALNWTFGFFHSTRAANIHSDVTLVDQGTGDIITPQTTTATVVNGVTVSPANVLFRRTISDRLEQTAGYGEVSYDLTSKLSVTGGARYYNYKKAVTGEGVIGNIIIGSSTAARTTARSSDSGWVFKGSANYKFTRDIMLYAEASQGYRPGGTNQVIGLPASYGPYGPDKLWNYEVGLKTAWFDRHLTLNVDVYQIDWSNIQISGQTNAQTTGSTFSFISNAGDARIRGVEVEANLVPMPGLSIHASGSYNDAVLTTNQTSDILVASGKKGDTIPNVPKWTLQGGVEYTRPLTDRLQAVARTDASFTGSTWNTFAHTDAYTQRLPGYTEVSARIGVEGPDGDWGVYVFGNNLLNELGLSSKGTGTLFGTGNIRVIGLTPRTIGVELRKRF